MTLDFHISIRSWSLAESCDLNQLSMFCLSQFGFPDIVLLFIEDERLVRHDG